MRNTTASIQRLHDDGRLIPMVTAYDYTSAQLADRAGIPVILVGDSLGMVVLGYPNTIPVTLDDMIHHAAAVVRGSQSALVVVDMPFLTYTTVDQAVANSGRLIQETGAQAVKLEGGEPVLPAVRRLVELGIPVMGHLGFTPQSEYQIGKRVQGRRADQASRLLEDALALQEAGAFAIVLELVPEQLAREITERLHIPTIGIGSGAETSGQVLVWHDLLGLYTDFLPRHTRLYASLAETINEALGRYAAEVRDGQFPAPEHSSQMDEGELQEALRLAGGSVEESR